MPQFKSLAEMEAYVKGQMDEQLLRNVQIMVDNGATPEEIAEATEFGRDWNARAFASGLTELYQQMLADADVPATHTHTHTQELETHLKMLRAHVPTTDAIN